MRKTILLCLCAFFFPVFEMAGTSVPHEELKLTVDPENGRISGKISVRLAWTGEWLESDNRIYVFLPLNLAERQNPYVFPLFEEGGPEGFSPAWIHLEELQVNSENADWKFVQHEPPRYQKYSTEHFIAEISLGYSPAEAEILEITMSYEARLANRAGVDDFPVQLAPTDRS